MPEISGTGRAISYQRVSTQGQATEDKSSFERQQSAFDAWCSAHPDYPPLETYRVARSGAEAGRFDWLLQGIDRGDFMPGDVLVVESLNRFGREAMADTLENLFTIWKTGIKTAFCDHREGQIFDKGDFNTDQSTIFLLAGKITAARDLHLDRKEWSRGSVSKNHQAIYQGQLNDSHFKPRQPGKRVLYPRWLDFNPKLNDGRGGFALNKDVYWIQRMFELALQDGQDVIAQKLNAEGFRSTDGRPVSGSTIGNQLKDPKVMGWWWPTSQVADEKTGRRKIEKTGPVKRDVFAAAITEELFEAVQRKMNERQNNKGAPNPGGGKMQNLFAGHCFCSCCGGLARRYSQAAPYGAKVRCSVSKKDIDSCDARGGITYDEEQLLKMLYDFRWEEYFGSDKQNKMISQITAEQSATQERLNAANQKVDNILKAQDDFTTQGRAWPQRLDEQLEQAQQIVIQVQEDAEQLRNQLADTSRQKTGKDAAEAIQERLRDFVLHSDNFDKRRDFNDWFQSTGLVFVFDIKQGTLGLFQAKVHASGRQRSISRWLDSEALLMRVRSFGGLSADNAKITAQLLPEIEKRLIHFRSTGEMPPLFIGSEDEGIVIDLGVMEPSAKAPKYHQPDELLSFLITSEDEGKFLEFNPR